MEDQQRTSFVGDFCYFLNEIRSLWPLVGTAAFSANCIQYGIQNPHASTHFYLGGVLFASTVGFGLSTHYLKFIRCINTNHTLESVVEELDS